MRFLQDRTLAASGTHHVPHIGRLSRRRACSTASSKSPSRILGVQFSLATSIRSAVRFMPIKAGAGHEQQGFNLVPDTVL